jgi:Icc-related predicted phosphoesterase
MRILAVSDIEDPVLGEHFDDRYWRSARIDFLVSCGDLPATYLSVLVSLFDVPLFYVPGNHDGSYRDAPPEGCESIDGRFVVWRGLRILGVGGSPWYNGGPNQYREWHMRLRIVRAKPRIWQAGGIDLIVTHAPPRLDLPPAGSRPEDQSILTEHPPSNQLPTIAPSANDHVHQGFSAFTQLIRTYHPRLFLHGHMHLGYGSATRAVELDGTRIVDAYSHVVLDL